MPAATPCPLYWALPAMPEIPPFPTVLQKNTPSQAPHRGPTNTAAAAQRQPAAAAAPAASLRTPPPPSWADVRNSCCVPASRAPASAVAPLPVRAEAHQSTQAEGVPSSEAEAFTFRTPPSSAAAPHAAPLHADEANSAAEESSLLPRGEGRGEASSVSTGWDDEESENDEPDVEDLKQKEVRNIPWCPRVSMEEVHCKGETKDPFFNEAAERLRAELKITWCLHDHYALLQQDRDKVIAAAVKNLGLFNYIGGAVNSYRTLVFARNLPAWGLQGLHAELERLQIEYPSHKVKLLVFVSTKETKQPLSVKTMPDIIVCPSWRSLILELDAKQHASAIATAIRHWDGRGDILNPQLGVCLCQDLAELMSSLR